MKGRILQLIHDGGADGIWDWQVAEAIEREYGVSGTYWRGNTRATLVDLHASGMIESVGERMDAQGHFGHGKVLFRFRVNAFGRQRMRDTDLVGDDP